MWRSRGVGRADAAQVAVPYIKRFLLRDRPLPVMMLQNGMASVYEAGGAEYGPWGLEGLKEYERVARYVCSPMDRCPFVQDCRPTCLFLARTWLTVA